MAPRKAKPPAVVDGSANNDGHLTRMTPEERAMEEMQNLDDLPSSNDTISVLGDDDNGRSDVSQAIKDLLGSDLRTSTELTAGEVQHLTVLLELAGQYNLERIVKFCENYMALKVSLNRGSRREVVQAFSGLESMSSRGQQQDIFARLRGGM